MLVIHPGALGDVLQAVPALRALGDGARVTFCGQPRLGEVLAGAGVVADAASFDGFGLEILFTAEPASPELTGRLGGFARVVSWFGSRDERYPERLRALAPSCVVASPLPAADDDTVWQHLLATLGRLQSAGPAHLAPVALPESWRDRARSALDEVGARRDRAIARVAAGAEAAGRSAPPISSCPRHRAGGEWRRRAGAPARGAGRRGGRGPARPRRRIADAHPGVTAATRPGRRPVNRAGLSRRGLRGEPFGRGGGRARRHPLPGGHAEAVAPLLDGAAPSDGAGPPRPWRAALSSGMSALR